MSSSVLENCHIIQLTSLMANVSFIQNAVGYCLTVLQLLAEDENGRRASV